MNCAPIIIPTLNRAEHLKECIESLKTSPLANETDLYISVDYPPNEQYVEGYEQVKKYVKEDLKGGFRNIYIYIQEENLGAERNSIFLREKSIASSKTSYIFTEDDNVFSPAFLEYINYSLEKYEEDENIFRICGYSPLMHYSEAEGDSFLLDHGNGWGMGIWRRKEEDFEKWLSRENFMKLLKNSTVCNLLYSRSFKKYWNLVEACLSIPGDKTDVFSSQLSNNIRNIDYTAGIYMTLNGLCALFPKNNLVVNNGFDGTGINCGEDAGNLNNSKLFCEEHFNSEKIFELYDTDVQAIFCNDDNREHAKRAKMYREIAICFGIGIARKVKKLLLYIDYKKYLTTHKQSRD